MPSWRAEARPLPENQPELEDLYFCPEEYSQDGADFTGRRYHDWDSTVTLLGSPDGQIGVKVISICTRCRALVHDARTDLGPLQVKAGEIQPAKRPPPQGSGIVVAHGANIPGGKLR